jgi:hypothetical protein
MTRFRAAVLASLLWTLPLAATAAHRAPLDNGVVAVASGDGELYVEATPLRGTAGLLPPSLRQP